MCIRDRYKTNATRQLLNLPLDPFAGYSSRKVNAGNIQNEGLEISLNGAIFQSPDMQGFNWNATAQFSLNRNKIIDLYPGVTLYDIKTLDAIQIVAAQGSYYGDIYGQTFLRVTDKDSPHYGKVIVGDDGLPLILSLIHILKSGLSCVFDFLSCVTNERDLNDVSIFYTFQCEITIHVGNVSIGCSFHYDRCSGNRP